jgi:peptide/nickel transport system substrate-binding protein
MLRGTLGYVLPAAMWGLAAGCTLPMMAQPVAAQQQGGTLIAAFSADPAGFDPVRGPSGMSHVVIEQVYSTLMLLDPDAKPIPGLAESYETSEDGLAYTFKLREVVTFHKGDPLTAQDEKFSFDR